ncbi:MAG: L-seryl-tRNA(Sec) selenium transferase [bacterium]
MAAKMLKQPRDFPSVEELLQHPSLTKAVASVPRPVAAQVIKDAVAEGKAKLAESDKGITERRFLSLISDRLHQFQRQEVTRVINAAGIVVHTNLGRAPLSGELFDAVRRAVTGYGNVEYDLAVGKRGSRGVACERYLATLAGAAAATVVNNNAAALFIILNTLANRKEVIVSRGELVQIGGGFRIPDILRRSGARLCEVGATNITTGSDYAEAISKRTGLILKVHQSNFKQSGFTRQTSLKELVALGRKQAIPVVDDLGSGVFVDTKKLTGYREPTVQQSVRAGASLTCFSGDKLLGGIQAGLIVGQPELIKKIKKNPLFRALRVDKIVFSTLEKLLRVYLDGDPHQQIRLWRQFSIPEAELYKLAKGMLDELKHPPGLTVMATKAYAGGGALPEDKLPSVAISFAKDRYDAARIESMFRSCSPPVIGRIENDSFLLDLKAVLAEDYKPLTTAVGRVLRTYK